MVDGPPLPGCGSMGVTLAALSAALLVLAVCDFTPAPGRVVRRRLRRTDEPIHRDRGRALPALGRQLSRGAVEPEDEALVGGLALATAVAQRIGHGVAHDGAQRFSCEPPRS